MIITNNKATVLKRRFSGNPRECINSLVDDVIAMWSPIRKQMTFVVKPNDKGFASNPHHYQPHANHYFFFIWPTTESIYSGEYFLHRVTIGRFFL